MSDAMKIESGRMVNENVRLLHPLAKGAMGQVWVADHRLLKIPVAVKLMHHKLCASEQGLAKRFAEEASSAARIKSAHVVQTHDCGVMADGTPFIVMELLEGESLSQRLARDAWIDLAETAQIVVHVAKALAAAHRLAIVHCDIKPANVFLTASDDGVLAKVFDFGIATRTELDANWKQSDTMQGTPQFLSPEHFKGEEIGPHADQWALAVLAYRCLTGRHPFAGETLSLLGVAVLSGDFVRPSQLRRDLPKAVDLWFERCFATDRGERFESVKDMAVSLCSLVPASDQLGSGVWGAGALTGIRPQLESDTFSATILRRPWSGAAFGGAATLVIAAGAITVVYWVASPRQSTAPAAPMPSPIATLATATSRNSAPAQSETAAPSAAASGAPSASASAAAGPWPPPQAGQPKLPPPAYGTREPSSPPAKKPAKGAEDYGF